MTTDASPRLTPRQRVLTALTHRQPDRVPFAWGFGTTAEMGEGMLAYYAERGIDWPRLRQAVTDVIGVGPAYRGPAFPPDTDMWGIRRKTMRYGAGSYDEIAFYPLAGVETVAEIDAYAWPSADWFDYTSVRNNALTADPERRYATRMGSGNPFEIYCWMTGLEEAMINLLANPEVVVAGLTHITDFFAEKLRRTLEVAGDVVDLVFLADDLGSQQGLLMSRDHYRAVLQPFHRQLAEIAHRLAPQSFTMFHSDGAVFDVLPDLIDAGIDVLEAVQTDAAGMAPERLKTTFGDRLSFHGAISVQQLLPHSDAATVADECRRLMRVLGNGGGYIAAPSHAIQVGTPPENVDVMLRTVLGETDYQAAVMASLR